MTNTKWPHCRMTKCFYGDRCKNAALNTHTCTAGHSWHHLCASQIDNIEDMRCPQCMGIRSPVPDEAQVNRGLPVAAGSGQNAVYWAVPVSGDTPAPAQQSDLSQSRPQESDEVIVVTSPGRAGSAKQGSEGGGRRVVPGAGTRIAQGVEQGQGSVGEARTKAKTDSSKERVGEDVINRRMKDFGVKKVDSKHPGWKYGLKYKNPPTNQEFRYHALCKICLESDRGMATVKLGSSGSPSAFWRHLQTRHPDEWSKCQEAQSRIDFAPTATSGQGVCKGGGGGALGASMASTPGQAPQAVFESRDAQGRSTRESPGRTAAHVHEGSRAATSSSDAVRRRMTDHFDTVSGSKYVNPVWMDKLVELIAEQYLPFNFAESEAFRE